MPNAEFKEWKQSDGSFVLVNGNPVAVFSDGTELPFDYKENHVAPLGKANREAAERRERIAALERDLEPWNALEMTPAEIKTAKDELAKLKKQTKAAGNGDGGEGGAADVAKLAELTEQLEAAQAKVAGFESQIKELTEARDGATRQVHDLTVGAAVRNSKYFTGRDGNQPLSRQHPSVAARDLAEYGEPGPNGSVVWYTGPKSDKDRKVIRGNDGEPAGTDEAMAAIGPKLDWWKDLLREKGATGSGASGGAGADGALSGIAKNAAELNMPGVREKTIAALKERHGDDWREHYNRILLTKE